MTERWKMTEHWNRCDVCGKFIPLEHFHNGSASRTLITPDSYYSKEEYETVCANHNLKVGVKPR